MAKVPGGKAAKISLPTNLSFRRSVDVSEGGMYSVLGKGKDETLEPVLVTLTTVRGAIASFTAGYGGGGVPLEGDALAKAQHNPAKPNIQSIDRAALDPESDVLALRFSVAFHGASVKPDACADADYTQRLDVFHQAARDAGLHRELAARYLWNLVNGRVLWRNGTTGLPDVAIVTNATYGGAREAITFDWGKLPRDKFPGEAALVQAAPGAANGAVDALIGRIAEALSGVGLAILPLDVEIRVRLYKGAEVWPSQEFVEKSQKVRDGREISRVLSSRLLKTDQRHATIHSQKIGNAVRTIDEWHGDDSYGAVPVEAFGWIQRDMVAIRKPDQRSDAYAAFSDIALITDGLVAGGGKDRALYTLAMLVRGGVYGVSGKGGDETKTEKTEKTEGTED